MGYAVNSFCFNGQDDNESSQMVARAVEAMSFWPPDDSAILWVDINSVDSFGTLLDVQTESGTQSLFAFPCTQQGPWPDPYFISMPQAAGLALAALLLWGMAWGWRSGRFLR